MKPRPRFSVEFAAPLRADGVTPSALLAKTRAEAAQAALFWREMDEVAHWTLPQTPLSLCYEPQRHGPAPPLAAMFEAAMSERREAGMREHIRGVRRAAAELLRDRMAYHHLRKHESRARTALVQAKREQVEDRLQLPCARSYAVARAAETEPSTGQSGSLTQLAGRLTVPASVATGATDVNLVQRDGMMRARVLA